MSTPAGLAVAGLAGTLNTVGLLDEQNLTPRQRAQYDALERISETYGKWDISTTANGAHYAPAAANPFKPELVCSRCSFYEPDTGQCEIVNGPLANGAVEPNAVCKLWIIPDPTPQPSKAELGTALLDALNR